MTSSTKDKDRITIWLPKDVKRALQLEAVETRQSASKIVEDALVARITLVRRPKEG